MFTTLELGKFMQRSGVRFSLDTGFHNFGLKVLVPVIKSWRANCNTM